MSKRKKGAIEAQTVLYVLSLIIIAFILLFGVKSIFSLKNTTDDISTIQFKSRLDQITNYVKGSTGTIKQEELYIPGDFTKICFIDTARTQTGQAYNFPDQMIIKDSVESKAKKNVFLIGKSIVEDSYYIPNLEVDSGFLDYRCIPISKNKVYIRFEGKGNSVGILCPAGNNMANCIDG